MKNQAIISHGRPFKNPKQFEANPESTNPEINPITNPEIIPSNNPETNPSSNPVINPTKTNNYQLDEFILSQMN